MSIITGKTGLVGLLGEPVNHSLSPVIQNAAIQEMALDWCYLAMPCMPKDLSKVIPALRELNCHGLNITIPHKQEAIYSCKTISPLAKKLGAVNTLVPDSNGNWMGMNTDMEGFLAPLKNESWKGKKAVVLGCGGSAKSVIAGLEALGFIQITIVGRNIHSLNSFLQDMKSSNPDLSKKELLLKGIMHNEPKLIDEIESSHLIVNATPVGMHSNFENKFDSSKIPLGESIWKNLNSETILYDLIYTPRPTAWLNFGKAQGCRQIDGLEMLIQQGAASLRLWSGEKEVPIEVMRKAAENHLRH